MKKPILIATIFGMLLLASLSMNFLQFQATHATVPTLPAAVSAQGEILCDVAKEQLREHWNDQRANIERIIRVVNNPGEMEGKLKLNLEEIAKAVPLDESQLQDFAPHYEKVFRDHVDKFKGRLNAKPEADWPGMLATMKEFYAAEDTLITSSYGAKATEAYRQSQARKRTPILAIIAQYAGLDWGQSITW